MATLAPEVATRLSKLVPRLASDQDGEVVATARAMQRVLSVNGVSLHELAAFLLEGPGERIVFRERVVYRDAPAKAAPKPKKPRKAKKPQPAKEAVPEAERDPNKDYEIGAAEILRDGIAVLNAGGLSEREDDFIRSMMNFAKRLGEDFHMTLKQAKWWRDLVNDFGIHPQARAAA